MDTTPSSHPGQQYSRLAPDPLSGCRVQRGAGLRVGTRRRAWAGLLASILPQTQLYSVARQAMGPLCCLLPCVPWPPGQPAHYPSSLPATEAWGYHVFSQLSPLSWEAPFDRAGWSCPRKTDQDTQADCPGASVEFQRMIGWWL